jgi:hypothetical protein
MLKMGRLVLASLIATTLLSQTPGSIEGAVLNDRSGLPLSRAHVVLRPQQAGLSAISADTDDKGTFSIGEIEPGRYSLSASRDGYLTSSVCLIGATALPQTFTIHTGESVTGLKFRLRPFAVIAGRVSFDDGEPAMNVRVEAYREHRNHLRHGYAIVGAATTNDRGEYRMFGLAPGSYVIAATYDRPAPANEKVRERQEPRYTTTFYTRATKLSETVPVRLEYGQETGGIDIFLERVRKVKIHGTVVSGVTGFPMAAAISLQRLDANGTAAISVAAQATFDQSNRFEIRDVTPGPYILWAEGSDGGKALVGHVPVTVSSSDIDNADVTIVGDRPGSAVLVVEGGVKLNDPVRVRFEPRNERSKVVDVSQDAGSSGFRFSVMENDVYDAFVTDLPNDFYLSAVRVNGADMMAFGIDGAAASADRPFELVLDSRGGRVSGRVLGSDGSLWSRASVALIPDPPRGRVQSYREAVADENGLFQVRGIAPGRYALVAWLDDPPCDYYDPDGLATCRAAGVSVEVREAGEQNIELKIKTVPKR